MGLDELEALNLEVAKRLEEAEQEATQTGTRYTTDAVLGEVRKAVFESSNANS